MSDENEHKKRRKSILKLDQKFSNENSTTDWHPADIRAALTKRGHSLASLSRANGYSPTAAGRCLRTSWPAMEEIIAEALERQPQEIWPSRYDARGLPIKYLPRKADRKGSSR